MAPTAATTAATKNSEQKIRRHFDDVNVDVGFGFVIIELPVRLVWLLVNGRRDHACSQSADVCQTISGKSYFEARTRRLLDQREEVSAINFARSALGVRCVFASLLVGPKSLAKVKACDNRIGMRESWPHAPPHYFTPHGTYIITAATLHRAPLFGSGAKLGQSLDVRETVACAVELRASKRGETRLGAGG
jgi:hypothetical protein